MSLNGIAGAGGVGKVMAEWIIDGEPSLDLHEMNIRRWLDYDDTGFVAKKAREVYHYYYRNSTRPTKPSGRATSGRARSTTSSPTSARSSARKTRNASTFPPASSRQAADDQHKWGWGRAPDHDLIREECLAARERASLFDMTSFGKFEVSGPGALGLLQRVACNNVDRPDGSLVYTQFLNARGGVESDLTICRLADDRFPSSPARRFSRTISVGSRTRAD